MSKIGYIRVSTEHQETARQQEIMCDYQVDRIFSEKLSGANTDRPQLKAMLDYVREGDTLCKEWKDKHITGRIFMRRMDLSANTFYRRVMEYEICNDIAEQTIV
jgi:DNA invertase Pin-like site-specific DNA recombinase